MPLDATALSLLGGADLEQIGTSLIHCVTLSSGEIEAQEVGQNQPSLASAGSVLLGAATCAIPDDVLVPISDLCYRAIGADGRLSSPSGHRPTDWTSWSAGQVLLGLLKRPHLYTDMRPLIKLRDSLITDFFDGQSGEWSFRRNFADHFHPLLGIYPTLALRSSLRVLGDNSRVLRVLDSARSAVRAKLTQSVDSTRLLLLHFLNRVNGESCEDDEVTRSLRGLETVLLSDNARNQFPPNVAVHQRGQPLWFATLHPQTCYLLTRRLWPLDHELNSIAITALLQGFDAVAEGWRAPDPEPSANICSWATALGLLAVVLLRRDMRGANTDAEHVAHRLQEVTLARYTYDVVISFSGKQRIIAETIARQIKSAGFTVFYDNDRRHDLLGEELTIYLQRVYLSQSRFAVAVLSSDFVTSDWAGGWEWRAILARMQSQRAAYVLPYYVEQVTVPGLNPRIGYISASTHTPQQFADVVIDKLRS